MEGEESQFSSPPLVGLSHLSMEDKSRSEIDDLEEKEFEEAIIEIQRMSLTKRAAEHEWISAVDDEGIQTNQQGRIDRPEDPPMEETVTRQPFIILVHTPFLGEDWFKLKALERLRWISSVFSHQKYPNRRLVLIHNSWIYFGHINLGPLREWECYEGWEDVYVKLLQSRYRCLDPMQGVPWRWYDIFDCSQRFVFGAYINLRRDLSEAGFGYGLSERHTDRCPLRALLLATRGHAVCLDWGYPLDLGIKNAGTALLHNLADMLDHDVFIMGGTRERRQGPNWPDFELPDGHSPQQPFARAIRNGHYLGSYSSSLDELPKEVVENLLAGVNGRLFTEAQAQRGRWIGWWELFFAEDFYSIRYHQWHFAERLQTIAIYRYILAHRYWASSTWAEAAADGVSLLVAGIVYIALDVCFGEAFPSSFSSLMVSSAAILMLALAWDVWIHYINRRLPLTGEKNDRPPHRVFLVEFVRVAIYAPILGRPVLILIYCFLERVLLPFRIQYWYWQRRHKDPPAAICVEAVYIFVVVVITLALPRSAATWGDVWTWSGAQVSSLLISQASPVEPVRCLPSVQ